MERIARSLLRVCVVCSLLAGARPDSGNSSAGRRAGRPCPYKSSLDDCLGKLPPILEKAELTGLPRSKAEVDTSCRAFKTGMGCIDEYAARCMSEKDRLVLEDHVAGARYTFTFLCDDPGFQADYLKYTTCYRGISADWDGCAKSFVQLVRDEMSRRNVSQEDRLVELCCAKHGFLRCVYTVSRLKCRQEEALFLNKIADTLSNMRVYTPLCRSVDVALCGARRQLAPWAAPLACWALLAALADTRT
ncbi:uncharacterized protein LOC134542579 [Bacillus rossius redtenbacheri]|uniref:uncharacterized protein LOC134542579 n=1 Tax=Bacillus rossius redtenbacheri TaxID=93214 RepID=UPI002FDE695C